MTSRLPGFGKGLRAGSEPAREQAATGSEAGAEPASEKREPPSDESPKVVLDRPVELTGSLVDEAVGNVVEEMGLSVETAERLKSMMGRDVTRGPAHAYFTSRAAVRRKTVGPSKTELTIVYAIKEEDVKALVDYSPDFKLSFRSSEEHDHPMAAACRQVDHALIMARLPLRARVSDVGGNPMVHIRSGREKVHVCGPIVDHKDEMRHTLRRMQAKKMVRSDPESDRGRMAAAFLNRDPEVICNDLAQNCKVKADVITMVHVYDIPLRDLPSLMISKGASLLEGCVLFSDRFLQDTYGILDVTKARYEVFPDTNHFTMGFEGSPSLYYDHNWTEFLLYGTDQILVCGTQRYAYSVVERRGDTLFYRILKLEKPLTDGDQRYQTLRLPGVPLVEVDGFELGTQGKAIGGRLVKKKYRFPRALWYEMVSHASEAFERGMLDFNAMYNHYRTASVRQSINAVLIVGGETVPADELVPLVVHSCLAAAAMSMLGQRETRALTTATMALRARSEANTMRAVGNALRSLLNSTVMSPASALTRVRDYFMKSDAELLRDFVMEWQPVAQDKLIPISDLQFTAGGKVGTHVASLYVDEAARYAVFDHVAAVVSDKRLYKLLTEMVPHVEMPTPPEKLGQADATVDVRAESSAPTYTTGDGDAAKSASRQAAILEHIHEIQIENQATETVCKRAYSELCIGGQPIRSMLKKKFEMYKNPDLWLITNGVVGHSSLGLQAADFKHSAVYNPRADPDTGRCIRSVAKYVWRDEREGIQVVQISHQLADTTFNGWVLTCDNLLVHNGPEIIQAMQDAVALDHSYDVVLHKAPPGSGKTWEIVHQADVNNDFVTCPVKESITDTRAQLADLYPEKKDLRDTVRTLDSYLANCARINAAKWPQLSVAHVDECFMTHAGKIYATAARLGVHTVHAYGDEQQIFHIPRVEVPKLHVRLKHDTYDEKWVTRRCPPNAVAAWGHLYDWKVRSMSNKIGAPLKRIADTKGMEIPTGCLMMCMYQADKVEIRRRYSRDLHRIKVLTAHEAEGKTYSNVWLHRFDMRRRSDTSSLFDQPRHCLVAMSRHTDAFYYVSPEDLGDTICKWILNAEDVRRVAAASDVESAGQPKQFT